MKGRRIFLTMLLAVLGLSASAQPDIRIQASNLVGVNEQFNLSFVVSGEDVSSGNCSIEWSPGPDFDLVWGPSQQFSSSTSIIGGKRTSTRQLSFTYVLIPKSTGTFNLPEARITVKGKTYNSGSPKIEVVKNEGGNSSSSSGGRQQSQGSQQVESISDSDLYMRVILSKRNVVVGERITATLKLYQRVNIAGFENARFPEFQGFWNQQTVSPTNIEFERENVNDNIYYSAVLASWTLIPQQAGTLEISPAELVCLVNVRAPRTSTGSIFDSFFQDDYRTVRRRITTDAVKVNVRALPDGAPASFTGAVGTFSLSASLSRDSLSTHEAASLLVNVTGTGNTALLEAPAVKLPPDFETYDVRSTDIQGGKQFEYPFIARSHGEFDIPPVEFSYYDVKAGRYVTLRTKPMHIGIARSADTDAQSSQPFVSTGVERRDVKSLGTDIRYISRDLPALKPAGSFFIGSPAFVALAVLLPLLALIAFFAVGFVQQRRSDVVGTKTRRATQMARKRLSEAGVFLKKGLYTAFFEELHRALLGYVSDKLNMDPAELSKDNISERLAGCGVPEQTVQDYISLLDDCEFARYAPTHDNETMDRNYDKAVAVISEIDAYMNRKKKGGSAVAMIAGLMMTVAPFGAEAAGTERVDSLWNEAAAHYDASEWDAALSCWQQIAGMGLEAEELYYNMGNAFFKSGDVARAVLCYERALKLNPSHADARFNLEFVSSMVQDRIEEVPEFFLTTFFKNVRSAMSSNAWTAIALVTLTLTLALMVVLFRSASGRTRRLSFALALLAAVVCIFSFSFASSSRKAYFAADSAIVMNPVCTVKSAPSGDSAKDLFVLHEGTKVRVIESASGWSNIELSDGRQGWLRSSEIEVI